MSRKDVNKPTVRALAKKAGVSGPLVHRKRAQGKTDEQIIIEANARRRNKSAGAHPRKGTLLYEQWRHTREKADREALDRKILEGLLLKREEVRTAVSGMISTVKTKLLMVGDELSDHLAASTDPVACRVMIDDRIHRALSELAGYPASA